MHVPRGHCAGVSTKSLVSPVATSATKLDSAATTPISSPVSTSLTPYLAAPFGGGGTLRAYPLAFAASGASMANEKNSFGSSRLLITTETLVPLTPSRFWSATSSLPSLSGPPQTSVLEAGVPAGCG
jgi:hypothetical protein